MSLLEYLNNGNRLTYDDFRNYVETNYSESNSTYEVDTAVIYHDMYYAIQKITQKQIILVNPVNTSRVSKDTFKSKVFVYDENKSKKVKPFSPCKVKIIL